MGRGPGGIESPPHPVRSSGLTGSSVGWSLLGGPAGQLPVPPHPSSLLYASLSSVPHMCLLRGFSTCCSTAWNTGPNVREEDPPTPPL